MESVLAQMAKQWPKRRSSGLRIAVDFPWDASAHMGTGVYSETMVRALAQAAPESEIFLLMHKQPQVRVELPNVRYIEPPTPEGLREGFRQVAIPAALETLKIDCLFAPATVAPVVKICPLVVTVHDLTFMTKPEYYAPSLVQYLNEHVISSILAADQLVAISKETEESLVRLLKIPQERITIIEQPIRESLEGRIEKTEVSATLQKMGMVQPFCFHISNLAPHKNTFFLLQVLKEIHNLSGNRLMRLVIGGGGVAPNQPPDFLAEAERLGLKAQVQYVGRVSDLELKALYQGCSAFLFPSLMEGWGLPVAEARALGMRALGSKHVPAADPGQRIELVPELWARAILDPKIGTIECALTDRSQAGQRLFKLMQKLVAGGSHMGVNESTSSRKDGSHGDDRSSLRPRNELAVGLVGDWHSPSGLGEAARNLYRAIKRVRGKVEAIASPKDSIQQSALFQESITKEPGQVDVLIHTLQPGRLAFKEGVKNIIQLAWETDALPTQTSAGLDWAAELNRADEVWVMSQFLVEVLRRSKVSVPIKVVPIPIDTDFWSPGPRRRLPCNLPRGFDETWTVFLYVGTWDPRKRPDILVDAYCRAFKASDRVLLLVKSYVTGDSQKDQAILNQWVANSRSGDAPIQVLSSIMAPDELLGLFRAATVFATASRGEGYCLPAVQAMACGKPVLAPKWSAFEDFVSIPVKYRLAHVPPEIKLPGYHSSMRWAEVDIEDLVQRMRWTHANRLELARLGHLARAWVLNNAGVEVISKQIDSFLSFQT